jgi:LysR family transcriptional regulator, regulatory protein for tcuABC
MARLEEEVGKALLVRSARGVAPTPNGEALYHHAKFVLRHLDEAVFVARQEYSDVKGRVTIGLDPTTVSVLGLPLLDHLRDKYPGIVLNVVAVHSGYLEEMVRSGGLDVAILFNQKAASELDSEPLLEEDLFLIVPTGSALVPEGTTSLTLAEVAGLPLIVPSAGYGLRRRITLEFERAGLTIEPVVEVDSLLLTMLHCQEGGGATIQPIAATEAFGSTERWRCLAISDAHMTRPSFLYALPIPKLSAAAYIVWSEVKALVALLIASAIWRGARLVQGNAGGVKAAIGVVADE